MSTPTIRHRFFVFLLLGFMTLAVYSPSTFAAQASSKLHILKNKSGYTLNAKSLGNFHTTANKVENARWIQVPDSRVRVALWEEKSSDGATVPFYAISLDGSRVARLQKTSYDIMLRYGQFDPTADQPAVPELMAATSQDSDGIYIVQFVTQPLEEYRRGVRALGGTLYKYLANHAYLVKMDSDARDGVAKLPFVRWVGPYHPAYRLEEAMLAQLTPAGFDLPVTRYNIQVFERGAQQSVVAERIQALGGTVHVTNPEGFRMEATLDRAALMEVVQMNEVQFIDRWMAPEADVTTAREIGGANYVETVAGFTGNGVRGEVMDLGVRLTHQEFRRNPLIVHGANPGIADHGTSTTGIVFGTGDGDARARGLLPDGQGIVAGTTQAARRYQHTQELVQEPYNAVFQSNSWGGGLTPQYTTVSAEMDDILFNTDLLITQSQSNAGSQQSRPEAWAKNIVSVGGLNHRGSLDMDTHCWCRTGSIGPAADGRIKPDLAHFYDQNYTTNGRSDNSYNPGFGGTSAATPITAGYFGLFFEMWHNGIFGNPTGKTVFESRPHAATAKAMLINTAKQWSFSGTTHDRTRTHQGWGLADVRNLYDLRDKLFVIDQTDVLKQLESTTYQFVVEAGGSPLRVTLVYRDPRGTVPSSQHRINKVNLQVVSPSQVVYNGNNGLLANMWSDPGGVPDTKNTVENVFVQNPQVGVWTVTVTATEVNEDGHPETPDVDADYALVVSGVASGAKGKAAAR